MTDDMKNKKRRLLVERILADFSLLMETYGEDDAEYDDLEGDAISFNMWALDHKLID